MTESEIQTLKRVAAPAPARDIVALTEASPPEQAEIRSLLAEIDLTDSSSVVHFGVKAQQQLTQVSDQMLEGVRAKDTGAAGGALSEMVGTLRGFDVEATADWFAGCGADYVVFPARCNLGTAYYNTKVGIRHAALEYDLIGKLAEGTQLTRRAVADILSGLNVAVFAQFKTNPESFIAEAIRLIDPSMAEGVYIAIITITVDS